MNTKTINTNNPEDFIAACLDGNNRITAHSFVNEAVNKEKNTIVSLKIRTHEDKNSAIGEIREQLLSLGVKKSKRDDYTLVADELVTNGLYKGPTLCEVTLKLLFGNDLIQIECIDNHGTLDLMSYLSQILNTYKNGLSESINKDGKGAGIGGRLIFDRISAIDFTIIPKKQTCVKVSFIKGLRGFQSLTVN